MISAASEDDPTLTRMLSQLAGGGDDVDGEQLRQLFSQLRSIAGRQMRGGSGHTLQPTALVNEAYIKLFGKSSSGWNDRQHFFRVAATAMRQILVDHARRKQAAKRVPEVGGIDLDQIIREYEQESTRLLDLEIAISRLEKVDARAAQAIDLRFFAGRSVEEAASILGVSLRTFSRDLDFAKAFILKVLGDMSH